MKNVKMNRAWKYNIVHNNKPNVIVTGVGAESFRRSAKAKLIARAYICTVTIYLNIDALQIKMLSERNKNSPRHFAPMRILVYNGYIIVQPWL